MTHPVDHFNPQNTATFQARYFMNDQFWDRENGPVFFQLGGEAAQDPTWAVECNMVENAKDLQALVILAEHRFYGKSQPFDDLSTEHLAFLTSEQALADYAGLIEHLKTSMNMTDANRVVGFGGSYSGALSAWLRTKYPAHVVGAIATSAPVFAKLDFFEYMQVVNGSLSNPSVGGSDQCIVAISDAVNMIKEMMSTAAGKQKLGTMFNTCGDLTTATTLDITNFAQNLIGLFAGVVQYNQDNRQFEGATHTNITIDVVCGMMTEAGSDPVEQWAAINTVLTDGECTAFNYQDMITEMQNTALDAPAAEGGRQWTYQTCAEFAYFQTTDAKSGQPFGSPLPLSFSVQQCIDIYGPMFDQTFIANRVAATNTHYGGRDVLGTNILMPNGLIDPWHALSNLTPNPAYNLTTVFIEDGAHCSNMYPNRPSDSPDVRAARALVLQTLKGWVM